MKAEAVFVVVLVIIGGTSQGAILDQSQEQIDGYWLVICSDWSIAQTFTAGLSGQLEKIDLYLINVFETDLYPSAVSIVNVISGVPSDSVVGTIYADNLAGGWNSIDFSSESVFLVAGTQYGIVLYNEDHDRYKGTSTQWGAMNSDVYAGGSLWSHVNGGWTQVVTPPGGGPDETFYDKDAVFRTYMVPEPSTICFVVLGGFALLRNRNFI